MNDQAEKLRKIIDNIKLRSNIGQSNLLDTLRKKNAKVITVTSGKGGVGKTNITINLAISLSQMGHKVTIIDADFGLANVDVLFGIIPRYSLVDVIHNQKSITEVLSEGPNNIKFISGGSGVEELVRMERLQLESFVNSIALLDRISDIILVDTGAGLSDTVMSFVMAADEVLLVATPEPTSITDAYALVKMVSNRDPDKKISLIVNRAENEVEAMDILNKLSIVSEKFLSIKLYPLGFMLQDEVVIKAVKLQQPFSISYPKSQATKYIKDISRKLMDSKDAKRVGDENGIKGFVNRLVHFLSA